MIEKIIFTEKTKNSVSKPKKRKDGRYRVRLPIEKDTDKGIYKYKDFYGARIDDVLDKVNDFIDEQIKIQNNITESKENILYALENWLYKTKRYECKESSFDRLEQIYKNNFKPHIEHLGVDKVNEVRYFHIQNYMNHICDLGYSFSVYKKCYNLLSDFYDSLVEADLILGSPCKKLPLNTDSFNKRQNELFAKRESIRYDFLKNGFFTEEELNFFNQHYKLELFPIEIKERADHRKTQGFSNSWLRQIAEAVKTKYCFDEKLVKELNGSFKINYTASEYFWIFDSKKMKDTTEPRVLKNEEIERIKDVVANGYYREYYSRSGNLVKDGPFKLKDPILFIFLLNTGLRSGEALALTYKNCDLVNRRITIETGLSEVSDRDFEGKKIGNKVMATTPKTEKSSATIPINDTALKILKELKSREKEDYDGLVFNNNGKPLSESAVRKRFYALLRAAKVEHVNIHSLRHTFASKVFNMTQGDIKLVSGLLRHSDPRFTEKEYVELLKEYPEHIVFILNI